MPRKRSASREPSVESVRGNKRTATTTTTTSTATAFSPVSTRTRTRRPSGGGGGSVTSLAAVAAPSRSASVSDTDKGGGWKTTTSKSNLRTSSSSSSLLSSTQQTSQRNSRSTTTKTKVQSTTSTTTPVPTTDNNNSSYQITTPSPTPPSSRNDYHKSCQEQRHQRPKSPSRIPIPISVSSLPKPSNNNVMGRMKKLELLARAEIQQQQESSSSSSSSSSSIASASVGGAGALPSKVHQLGSAIKNLTVDSKISTHQLPSTSTSGDTYNFTAPPPPNVGASSSSALTSDKKGKTLSRPSNHQHQQTPWAELYGPSSIETHFVHTRKIDEVRRHLLDTSLGVNKILILSGPSGSGKTATLFTLAKEANYSVREWINPISTSTKAYNYEQDTYRDENDDDFGHIQEDPDTIAFNRNVGPPPSQIELFSEYLLRVSNFNCLPNLRIINNNDKRGGAHGGENIIQKHVFGTKPLILVEDLPNVFYKKPELLHQLIRNYRIEGGCPLVFIIADSAGGSTGTYKLFPPDLLDDLRIKLITFNPVAVSYIVKFLTTICVSEGIDDVDKNELEDLAIASNGDIRWAINNLEFKQLGAQSHNNRNGPAFKKPNLASTSKSKRGGKTLKERKADAAAAASTQPKDFTKDESLFLFHALGKVLYAKRNKTIQSPAEVALAASGNALVASGARIHPLLEDPDSILDKIQVSPATFFNFLVQNYTAFYESLDDVVAASSYLADSADILSHWSSFSVTAGGGGGDLYNGKSHGTREELGLSLAIRGLMHSNSHRTASSFRPLNKPLLTESNQLLATNVIKSHAAFGHTGAIDQDFYSTTLPFYTKFKKRILFSRDQLDLINDVGTFRKPILNCSAKQKLEDKDVGEDEADDTDDVVVQVLGGVDPGKKRIDDAPLVMNLGEELLAEDEDEDDDEGNYEIEDYDD